MNMDSVVDWLLELPAPRLLQEYVVPFLQERNILASASIARNLHSIMYVALFYHAWFLMGKYVIFPPFARSHQESKRKDLVAQSAVHLVSFVQSIIILYLSFKCLLDDQYTAKIYTDSYDRVLNDTRESEIICVFAIGYFAWDIYISTFYSTLPFVIHGVVSTVVFVIGLKPYIQYYAPIFLMFELSNPCLNIRWYLIKYFPGYDTILIINNLALMITFFASRIAWGWYQIGKLCYDFYQVRHDPGFLPLDTFVIVAGNFVLDVLNFIWFRSMVKVAWQVFTGKKIMTAKKSN